MASSTTAVRTFIGAHLDGASVCSCWALAQCAIALTYGATLQGRGLAEVEARRLLQQLLVALEFSHSRGIANRDVKVRSPF